MPFSGCGIHAAPPFFSFFFFLFFSHKVASRKVYPKSRDEGCASGESQRRFAARSRIYSTPRSPSESWLSKGGRIMLFHELLVHVVGGNALALLQKETLQNLSALDRQRRKIQKGPNMESSSVLSPKDDNAPLNYAGAGWVGGAPG